MIPMLLKALHAAIQMIDSLLVQIEGGVIDRALLRTLTEFSDVMRSTLQRIDDGFEEGWRPLKRAENLKVDWRDIYTEFKKHGISRDGAKAQAARLMADEIWLNDLYQVNVDRNSYAEQGIVHLSIKRRDKEPFIDWRHKQEIKNQLCGREAEAVELFPAESRLVDSANQFHLWCFAEGERVPVGWQERFVVDDDDADSNSKQRPRKESDGKPIHL